MTPVKIGEYLWRQVILNPHSVANTGAVDIFGKTLVLVGDISFRGLVYQIRI